MNELHDRVKRLRAHIDSAGLRESLSLLDEIVKNGDPRVIRHLLLLRAYREDDEHIDEMYSVIHALEGFPIEVFVREFVDSIEEMSSVSPYFLGFLLARMLNDDDSADYLIDTAGRTTAETQKRLIGIMEKVRE